MEQTEKKLYVEASIADKLPAMVKNELARMSSEKQHEFIEEYNRKAKSISTAFLLFFLLAGTHYAYIGKWGTQVLFWLSAGGCGIWAIIDIFRISKIIQEYNKDIAIDTLRGQKTMSM